MDKKVSVVIPCYNQGKYIKQAVDSVLKQTYKNIEIVIVNDCSTDNSGDIITDLTVKHPDIKYINNKENGGLVYSRNLAIEISSGDYILPLDADDVIEPSYIEKAVNVLDKQPGVGIVYSKARKFGAKNKIWKLPDFNKSDFLYSNCIFAASLFRKSDFINAGKYKDYMRYGFEDWDLWLSFAEAGLKPYRIDEVLFNYRQHNTKSKTDVCLQDKSWQISLLKNHINLYLEDKTFYERVFVNLKKLKRNSKRYKILLFISIIEFIIIIFCIAGLIVK